MTVITNPYTKDAIKSAIAQARQTNTSPSRSTKTLFPIEVQLDELRDELVQFTVKNHLYVTSPGRLGEQYTNLLDDFLEEHESEGVTYEQLNDLLDDAYKEGIRQRALKE